MMALNNGSMFFAIASGSSPAMPWIADVYTIYDGKDGRMEVRRRRTGKVYTKKQIRKSVPRVREYHDLVRRALSHTQHSCHSALARGY